MSLRDRTSSFNPPPHPEREYSRQSVEGIRTKKIIQPITLVNPPVHPPEQPSVEHPVNHSVQSPVQHHVNPPAQPQVQHHEHRPGQPQVQHHVKPPVQHHLKSSVPLESPDNPNTYIDVKRSVNPVKPAQTRQKRSSVLQRSGVKRIAPKFIPRKVRSQRRWPWLVPAGLTMVLGFMVIGIFRNNDHPNVKAAISSLGRTQDDEMTNRQLDETPYNDDTLEDYTVAADMPR